jgi:hypothetical protein
MNREKNKSSDYQVNLPRDVEITHSDEPLEEVVVDELTDMRGGPLAFFRKNPGVRRIVQTLSLAVGIMSSGFVGAKSFGENSTRITVEQSTAKDASSVRDEIEVEVDGESMTKTELNLLILESMRGEKTDGGQYMLLGHLVDDCSGDAERCFYYYENQLKRFQNREQRGKMYEVMSTLTGKSTDELTWSAGTIRSGFVKTPMRIGDFTGMVEPGRDILPPMTGEKKAEFYDILFELEKTFTSDAYKDFRIDERSTEEREAISTLVGAVSESRVEYAARVARVVFRAKNDNDFMKWFDEGIGDGHLSGEQKLNESFQEHISAVGRLYDYLDSHPYTDQDEVIILASKGVALEGARRMHHESLRNLFVSMETGARGSFFSSGAEEWKSRAYQQGIILTNIHSKRVEMLHVVSALGSK